MSRLDDAAKLLVVAVLITEISVFAEATVLTLMALALGGIMVALGSLYAYRPGAVAGLLVVATGAASSIQLDSVLEVSAILTAVLGLLLPLFVLALHALGAGQGDLKTMSARSRPAAFALLFGVACVLSAPLLIGLMGLFVPTMTMRLGGIAETAVLLLVAATGSVVLTRRMSAKRTIELARESGQ